ncbi:MAG: GNAT family N-acetyltransferase [Oscillospiraceae bacterium]|nr:GNAT family N-acetyltransferase [Oscillospiraceae bacterium]
MLIRKAEHPDLKGLLELYTQLHDNDIPEQTKSLLNLWEEILSDRHHHILLGIVEGQIIATCVIVIIPNLTQKQRPYAFIENVITHCDFRKKGYATQLLNTAKDIAVLNHCYKIMLMTGSKEENILNFYKKSGYNCNDKTAFIQWLD